MLSMLTNVQSIKNQKHYNNVTDKLVKTQERLTTGLRINSASDDAAGLQISNRMTTQINGLTQGNRNANSGIAYCQTIEGSMKEVTTMLDRIRTLANQAADGTNTSADRASAQAEVSELITEIQRIGEKTSYNDKQVLADGVNGTTMKFQVGANSGDTIDLTMKSMTDLCKGKSGSDDVTLAQLDISTQEGANKALDAVKGMISNVDSYRGTLGAKINRLGHAIENQNNVISNTEDSRMRIRDADSAEETANLTAYQIRQQAAVAMLSQANSSQSIVLSLLGG